MRPKVLALALPLLLAGCFAGEPATPPVPTGQIDGAVVDQLLRPYANHTVTLVQLDRTDQTSRFGGFTFREVPPGFYTLTTRLGSGETATQVVDVEPGRITRTILQLVAQPVPGPYYELFPFRSPGEPADAGQECAACEFAVPLDADRPEEVTFRASWHTGPVLGEDVDHLDILITDGRGFALYKARDLASPIEVSIPGADIHPDATELRVEVSYGKEFLPRTAFTMNSVLTLYHGATRDAMFGLA